MAGKVTQRTDGEIVRTHGSIRIDRRAYGVWVEGHEVRLTPTEFQVLWTVLGTPCHLFTRRQLLDAAWGQGYSVGERTVDACVSRLRKKLQVPCLEAVWGVGYRVAAPNGGAHAL
jgi:DNA-binding response OmpR family regulator